MVAVYGIFLVLREDFSMIYLGDNHEKFRQNIATRRLAFVFIHVRPLRKRDKSVHAQFR